MPILDRLTNPVEKVLALAIASVTGGETGVAIDLTGVIALNFTVLCTAYTSGDATLDIETSADGSTGWASVSSKYLIRTQAVAGVDDIIDAVDETLSIGLSGVDSEDQKFARLVVDGTIVMDVVAIAEISNNDR